MGYLIGAFLTLVGLVLGTVGDYPIGSAAYTSMELMVVGGLIIAAGVATILLTAGSRASREGWPGSHIRP